MDGAALLGMPTIYLEDPLARNVARMCEWVGPVPEYRRVDLTNGSQDLELDDVGVALISTHLKAWAAAHRDAK